METIPASSMAARKPTQTASPSPLGVRLKDTRQKRNLSMRDLAEAATKVHPAKVAGLVPEAWSVSHATISLVESGRQTEIDASMAVAFARALGVTVEWLVTGEGVGP